MTDNKALLVFEPGLEIVREVGAQFLVVVPHVNLTKLMIPADMQRHILIASRSSRWLNHDCVIKDLIKTFEPAVASSTTAPLTSSGTSNLAVFIDGLVSSFA